MSHRVIAKIDKVIPEADGVTPLLILVNEEEVISNDDALKEALIFWGWAKPYDDTKPLPPKGINVYEYGLSYPAKRYIIKDNALYKSNTVTSTAWVPDEWDLILQGA